MHFPPVTNPTNHVPGRLPVVIVAEGDIVDDALVSLVESFGFPAITVTPGSPAIPGALALIVRAPQRISWARTTAPHRDTPIICFGATTSLDDRPSIPTRARSRGARGARFFWFKANSPTAAAGLHTLLTGFQEDLPSPTRIHVTGRECEVLRTYTLGATLRQTSQIHHVAESTVREHYRRVARRYCEAGRPVGNKAQLLLALMADGWIASTEAETDISA
ncbi:helix-turn-helix transcriptional regulator [Gordonia sp. ABSL1-1]|uniref:helix-turn-helix transcriptional regulator n=1 Tax=Gordonia sp. ABSL1-1 TaxID=3053923 RepID=UPI0025726AE9|nr:helix-turn-helix transcriptional regulator [Gordonia sp. ABSL1-1]MDL9935323.1 helix-turn-helix transcriptional regulator [Gordonia sp. ABSL1-1]